jgi:hypothetical protein
MRLDGHKEGGKYRILEYTQGPGRAFVFFSTYPTSFLHAL